MSNSSQIIKEILFRLQRLGHKYVSISKYSHAEILNITKDVISKNEDTPNFKDLGMEDGINSESNKSDKMIILNQSFESHLLNDKCIFGQGSLDSKIVFVVDCTTPLDFDKNNFFNSDARILMSKIHTAMGISPKDTYVTSIIKSKESSSRILKGDDEDDANLNISIRFLKKELDIINPQIIVLLGVSAYRLLFDRMINMASFSQIKCTQFKLCGFKLLATYHPSYLILKDCIELKRSFWEVMLSVMKEMDLDISLEQDNFFKIG